MGQRWILATTNKWGQSSQICTSISTASSAIFSSVPFPMVHAEMTLTSTTVPPSGIIAWVTTETVKISANQFHVSTSGCSVVGDYQSAEVDLGSHDGNLSTANRCRQTSLRPVKCRDLLQVSLSPKQGQVSMGIWIVNQLPHSCPVCTK